MGLFGAGACGVAGLGRLWQVWAGRGWRIGDLAKEANRRYGSGVRLFAEERFCGRGTGALGRDAVWEPLLVMVGDFT